MPRGGLDFYRLRDGADRGGFRQLIAGDIRIPQDDMPIIEDLYTAGINAADFIMNRIVSQWMAHSPRGIVAVTSDHGEYLGEHGLWEHGKTVFTEVVDVPLVIAAPGRLPKGTRVSTPVQMQDLHDTLLALANIPGEHPHSLVPVANGGPRNRPIQAKAWASRPEGVDGGSSRTTGPCIAKETRHWSSPAMAIASCTTWPPIAA